MIRSQPQDGQGPELVRQRKQQAQKPKVEMNLVRMKNVTVASASEAQSARTDV